jgi:PleD family two-component response regulator
MHGGRIWVESTPRSRVDLRIHASRDCRRAGKAGMSKRILVVEDQEDNRQILRDLLTSADYEMMEAENGEEALAAVAKERTDLILMALRRAPRNGCHYFTTRPWPDGGA